MTTTEAATMAPFLTIKRDASEGKDDAIPIFFQEDWRQGIGGGLWSTGLAFSKYLTTVHAETNLRNMALAKKEGLSVLELGSGNGLLSVCLLALCNQIQRTTTTTIDLPTPVIQDLAITDMADHLPLMQKTLEANSHLLKGKDEHKKPRVHIFEHSWGSFLPPKMNADANANGDNDADNDLLISFQERAKQGKITFDLIIGSDVAYHEDLYDILITSLEQYAHAKTMILIGCTMLDTKPEFFHKLRKAGFQYRKFSDHLVDKDFHGQTFGIFVIEKQPQK